MNNAPYFARAAAARALEAQAADAQRKLAQFGIDAQVTAQRDGRVSIDIDDLFDIIGHAAG